MKSKEVDFTALVQLKDVCIRVPMKDYCEEKDGDKGLSLSITKLEELSKDKRFKSYKIGVAAIEEVLRLLKKGHGTFETYKEDFEGKNLQSAPRILGDDKYELHHTCLQSLGGSDTIGTNVIPLLPFEHIQIHTLMMFIFDEWKNDNSAAFMVNKKKIFLEEVLNPLDNAILEVNKDIVNLLVTIDRQSRRKAQEGRKKKKQGKEADPALEDYIQYRYTDKATEAYFQKYKLTEKKNYNDWCSLSDREVLVIQYRRFTKGIEGETLRLKHHLNVIHRAGKKQVRMAEYDLGSDLTMDEVTTLVFKDSDNDYAIRSRLGPSLGKIEKLKKEYLRKLCRVCKRPQGNTKKEMSKEVIKFLQSEDLKNQFSQMNI